MTSPQVDYELVVVEELPPKSPRGGGRESVLENQLAAIVENTAWHGRHVRIGKYAKGTAATAAKNVLQQRHGKAPAVEGWAFATRRLTEGVEADATPEVGLFAKFTPELVIEGAKALHEAAEKERKRRLAEAKAQRDSAADIADDVEDDEEEDEDEYYDEDEEEEAEVGA